MHPKYDTTTGKDIYEFIKELFPICRSITGNEVRKTHKKIRSIFNVILVI